MSTRIRETTLYSFMQEFATALEGVSAVSSATVNGESDLIINIDGTVIVLEVKITDSYLTIIDTVCQQVPKYLEKLNTNNFAIIGYPEEIRQLQALPEIVKDVALNNPTKALIMTRGWKERVEGKSFVELVQKIVEAEHTFKQKKIPLVSYDVVVEIARDTIEALATALRRHYGLAQTLANTAIGRFDMYRSLMSETVEESKIEEEAKVLLYDLTAYIIVNQLLFYHIVQRKRDDLEELPDVSPIQPPENLIEIINRLFKNIVDKVNYEPIFNFRVFAALLDIEDLSVLYALGKLIYTLKQLQPEHVKVDLIGRIYHDSIPPVTRKKMGAFYTNPIAAEILAGLSVSDWKSKVLDPACGSGTLLVAAYNQKKRLYDKENKEMFSPLVHARFLGNDMFGMDIMKFAAHWASSNLMLQMPEAIVENLNITPNNSLTSLYPNEKASKIGIFDTIIMNPPFTDFRRLPSSERTMLVEKFGRGNYNYWAYFLLASSNHVNNNGTIAAVLPDGFFRGGETADVRRHLLTSDFTLDFVIKNTVEIAYSERASFRDYLVIMKKKLIHKHDYVYIILTKKKMKELSDAQACNITNKILKCKKELEATSSKFYLKENDFTILRLPYSTVTNHLGNLYPPVAFLTEEMYLLFAEILAKIETSSYITKLSNLEQDGVLHIRRYNPGEYKRAPRDIWTKSKEIARQLFIARHKGEGGKWIFLLDKRSDLKSGRVLLQIRKVKRGSEIFVKTDALVPALRTYSGIKNMNVEGKSGYALIDPSTVSDNIRRIFGWDTKIMEYARNDVKSAYEDLAGNMVLAHKIRIPSPTLYWVSFYSDNPVVSSFMNVRIKNKEYAKVLTLWNNSVLGILQLLALRSEIAEAWSAFDKESVWGELLVPKLKALKKSTIKSIVKTFDEVGWTESLPLHERFASNDELQMKIDSCILRSIGMNNYVQKLPNIYRAITDEFQKSFELIGRKPEKSKLSKTYHS